MIVLDIYITDNCWSCEESIRIAKDVAPLFPNAAVNLLNINGNTLPEGVFAVPTYVMNGKIIFLGNPTREQLIDKLSAISHLQSEEPSL